MTVAEKLSDNHVFDMDDFVREPSPAEIAFKAELAEILKPLKPQMMDVALHFPAKEVREGSVDGIEISTNHFQCQAKEDDGPHFTVSFGSSVEDQPSFSFTIDFHRNSEEFKILIFTGQAGAIRRFAENAVTLFETPNILKETLTFNGMIGGCLCG